MGHILLFYYYGLCLLTRYNDLFIFKPIECSRSPVLCSRAPKKRADIRLLLCSVTICSVFIVLFLPSVIMNLIKGCIDPRFHMAASNITWLNSCVNPIVYAMMNTRFRKGQ